MRVIGLAGWSGSGKTTLVARLIPMFRERGVRVSTIKHAHHGFDVDAPGKDSHQHREAGAHEVLVSSSRRWALIHELRDEPELALPDLLAKLSRVDLVIIEGFKRNAHPKIEVYRPAVGKPLLALNDPWIVAIASDSKLPEVTIPVVSLNDTEAIADLMREHSIAADKIAKEFA